MGQYCAGVADGARRIKQLHDGASARWRRTKAV